MNQANPLMSIPPAKLLELGNESPATATGTATTATSGNKGASVIAAMLNDSILIPSVK